jgi:hypothetical protein
MSPHISVQNRKTQLEFVRLVWKSIENALESF